MAYEVALPGGLVVSDDPARLDVELVHTTLSERMYWARGRPRAVTEAAIAGSHCFGLYGADGRQCGFARVVTDHATFAWMSDVFVLEEGRGQGWGKALVAALLDHPGLAGIRRFMLTTNDAQGLYARHGFAPVAHPGQVMERLRAPTGD